MSNADSQTEPTIEWDMICREGNLTATMHKLAKISISKNVIGVCFIENKL
jgi:hypothetical protein